MEEIFKDIPNYEGMYQASNLGNVKSLDRMITESNGKKRLLNGRVLKPSLNCYGYLVIGLSKEGEAKVRTIHQLVAESFLNHVPCGNSIEVDHIDEDKLNNRLDNLQLLNLIEHRGKGSSSKYTGVSWCQSRDKWRAYINVNGKSRHLGLFTDELEAAKAYEAALLNWENKGIEPEPKKFSSKFKGVSWDKSIFKWRSRIRINRKLKHLGYFTDELEASKAYQNALSEII
tara:strand:+ start:91 stop:780 length:690 start_codon:yes stop_codon:yes gene_type:complete